MSVTQHRPDGTPGSPYGDFSGKAPAPGGTKTFTGVVTQHSPFGAISRLYGSFAGKSAAPPVEPPATTTGGGRRFREPLRLERPGPSQAWIDDQVVVALLMAFMHETEAQT
jgi:hypothetical protein